MEMIKSLFDFEFDKILTAKALRILYAIVVGVVCLAAMGFMITGVSENSIGLIILGPIGSMICLMFFRIFFESVVIKFQMAQDVRDIKNKYISSVPPSPPTL